jgi:hypothetical protein
LEDKGALAKMTCLEPACGAGHMAKVLKEYFREVRCADAHHYGYGLVRDFLTHQRIRRDVMKLARASDATTNFLRSLTSRELIELAERKPEPKINMTEMARAVRAGQ